MRMSNLVDCELTLFSSYTYPFFDGMEGIIPTNLYTGMIVAWWGERFPLIFVVHILPIPVAEVNTLNKR